MSVHLRAIGRTIAFICYALASWRVWLTVCRVHGWKPAGPHPVITFLVFLLLAALCSGIGWVVYRRYQRATNRLYTTEERAILRSAFREMNEQLSRQLRETRWKMALLFMVVSATAFFLVFLDASVMVACLATVGMCVVCRLLFLKGGVTVDLDEDVKQMLLRPKSTPNKCRVNRNENDVS
jgi:hypothetical protein